MINLPDSHKPKARGSLYQDLESHVVDLPESPSKKLKHSNEEKKLQNEEQFNLDMKNKEIGTRSNIKSKTTMNLSWLTSVKKVSTSIANSRLFTKSDQELLFCCSVDGSKHSDYAFDLVAENFMFPNSKLLCIYVFYSKLDSVLNYDNKKATVLDKYASKIERFKKQAHFITEDRTSKIHALEQACTLAENYSSNYLVCGYQGLKGPRGDNKEQIIGHDLLLATSKTPVMIIKEQTNRELKKNGAFKWLVVLDKQYHYPLKAFNAFLPLVDPEGDQV